MAGPVGTDAIMALLREQYGDAPAPDREGMDRGYVHWPSDQSGKVDYGAILADRGPQQEPGEGRLPTLAERAQDNPLREWWLSQGDKMREQAKHPPFWEKQLTGERDRWYSPPDKDSLAAGASLALLQAMAGLRAPGPSGSVAGSYPEPVYLPGLKDQPFHPTSNRNVFQDIMPFLGAYQSRKNDQGNYDGPRTVRERASPDDVQVPLPRDPVTGHEMQVPPGGPRANPQYLDVFPGMHVANPAEMTATDVRKWLMSVWNGGYGAGPGAVTAWLPYALSLPRRGFHGPESLPDLGKLGMGTSRVEPLGQRLSRPLP